MRRSVRLAIAVAFASTPVVLLTGTAHAATSADSTPPPAVVGSPVGALGTDPVIVTPC